MGSRPCSSRLPDCSSVSIVCRFTGRGVGESAMLGIGVRRSGLMLVAVAARAEVPLGINGLAALAADGPALLDEGQAVLAEGAHLRTGDEQAGRGGLLRIAPLDPNLLRHQHEQVTLLIV